MNHLSLLPMLPAMGPGVGLSGDGHAGANDSAFGEALLWMMDPGGAVSAIPQVLQVDDPSPVPADAVPVCCCGTLEVSEAEGWAWPGMAAQTRQSPDSVALFTGVMEPNVAGEPEALPAVPQAGDNGLLPQGGRATLPGEGRPDAVLREPAFPGSELLPASQHGWLGNPGAASPDPAVAEKTPGGDDPQTAPFLEEGADANRECFLRPERVVAEPATLSGSKGRGLAGLPEGIRQGMLKAMVAQTAPPQAGAGPASVFTETPGAGSDAMTQTPQAATGSLSQGLFADVSQRARRAYGMSDPLPQARPVGPEGQALSLGEGAGVATARSGSALALEGSAPVALPTAEDVTVQDLAEQMRAQLRVMASRGRERVTLQLHPASLGRLKLQVSLDSRSVAAELMTESTAVRDLVHAQLTTLKESLTEQGFQLERFEVHLQDPTAGHGSRDGSSPFRNAFRPPSDAGPNGDEAGPAKQPVPSQKGGTVTPEGRVNLFV